MRSGNRERTCLRLNSAVLTECHWNGVCGLGVKLEIVTLTAR